MKRVVRAGSPEILKIVGDSSPCSAETSFRELDDVFLQTQTRIWLGEVLHIRFDEETAIVDLLADGELLFQVSKVAWKMLLKKHAELKHSKIHIYERTSSGKSDGRYMPYPKVDSFLKICQILGLTGIDLFSPSDVVEKRDVRRVCMCIRSFSKKARSKKLNVPDFDIVTYTIAMPTDLVGGIRRNLEQSHISSSSSNGYGSSSMDTRELYRQRSIGAQSVLHYDSNSESDEAESAFTEFESHSPLSNASCDATKFSNTIGQHSPEGNLVVDGSISELQTQFKLDRQEQTEVVDNRSIQNFSHVHKVTRHYESSSTHTECQIDRGAKACLSNTEEVLSPPRNPRNIMEIDNVNASSYQNSVSTDGHFPHDLDRPHAVDAEEDFIQSCPTLWRRGIGNNLAKYSSSDSDVTLDHPKEEFVKALIGPSTQVQTVSCRLVDVGETLKYMESSNNNILEFQDMTHEKTPEVANEVNVEGKKENTSICAFWMDPSNSFDEVSSPRNYIKLQADNSDLNFHSIDNGNVAEMPAKCSSPAVGSVDLEQKDMQNGLKIKDVHEVEIAQVCFISHSISWEDKCANNDYPANTFSFPEVNNPKEVDLLDSIVEISANDQVSSIHLDSLSGSSNMQTMQYKNYCLNNNQISDCNGNESKICSTKGGYGYSNASTCSLEMDADEQVNSPGMSIMDADMMGNVPSTGESKIYNSTTLNVIENQLTARTYDMYKNPPIEFPPIEVKVNYTETFGGQDSSDIYNLSIPQVELMHADGRESCEQISHSVENGLVETKASVNMMPCLIDGIRNHELETEEMNSSDESTGIHSVGLETIVLDGASEATFSHDSVNSCMACSISNTCTKDDIQNHEILPCSTPVCTMEREIIVDGSIDVNNQGDSPVIDVVFSIEEGAEADDNGEIKKVPEECEKDPVPKFSSNEEVKERAKGKKVLKSVAGAMTLLGALFVVHHVRQRREKEKNTESIAPQINRKPCQKLPEQKRAEIVKPGVLYPGERLKL